VAQEHNQQDRADISKGGADAWREFLNLEIPQLYGMFMKRWPNPSLAEELVQKTVFDAVRGRNSFDPLKGTAEEWIFGIARNNIRLEIRRRASRGSINGDISCHLEAIDNEPLPNEVIEQKETVAVVRAALNNLESKEQTVLRAKYIDGLSANKIAQQMGVTEKAVHNLLYRARISLRRELERMAPTCEQE
jgi:RNA polymerase sigma-70 factor (ECF subfamily)